MASSRTANPIPMLRYTLRCLNGHEVPYDTPEWPGLLPVHCQVDGCGWQVPAYPTGDPIVVTSDVLGRPVCTYCGNLHVADDQKWEFCCGAQEEDAARAQLGKWGT